MSIEGQGHFFTIYFPVFYVLCFTRPIYQVSVYRTIGPLVLIFAKNIDCAYTLEPPHGGGSNEYPQSML